MLPLSHRVALRYLNAGPLTDVSKLRYQAVFLMGAGGSGKGHVSYRWLKYMPGGSNSGVSRKEFERRMKETLSEKERSLSNLKFEVAKRNLERLGVHVELVDPTRAKIPFRLYSYDEQGREYQIPPSEWEEELPPKVYEEVKGLREVIFKAPVYEVPSYWRQVNPDIYKEELAGYLESQPGYVHVMSADMSKAYFEAAVESGDPILVDATGTNAKKVAYQLSRAKEAGYRISLVLVLVPLTVNQIRNAVRPRRVDPRAIVAQWQRIGYNFVQLRALADKSTVIINRNDSADHKSYLKHMERIESFIRQRTSYPSLYDLIAVEAPQEIREWGALLSKGRAL